MYNPALPNHYRDVVFTRYVRRRQREEHEAEERQRQPNALASALSSLSSSTLTDAVPSAPSRLHLSAEELHQQRVKESAALGIESAVAMEQASLEAEHQRRRQEGEDARSRISSRLDKLKALAARSKTIASGAAPVTGGSSTPSPSTAAEQGGKPSNSPALPPPASSSSSPSAPLTFQRSSLGAGGFVLSGAPSGATASSSSSLSAPATTRAVRGKPSSTLLLRYARANPLSSWSSEQVAQAAARDTDSGGGARTAAGEELCSAVLRQVQELCRRFGCVRDVKMRVYTSADVASALSIASTDVAALEGEQLRVFVRYDSVTEAFKAAESLAKAPAMADGPVFSVCFYPTTRFDANTLELRAEDERAIV